jgi:NAD(P)-dependent dehydrogenase (short-subunit alcohol dehydrogenase family)
VAECEAAGAESFAVQADVAKDDDCRRLVQAAVDRWGRLDVLINNAAVTKTIPHQRFDLLDADEFQRVYSVNLIGNYQMCRAAAPHLKAAGDAAIVNISSVGAMRAGGSSMAYTASKAAINNLTLSTARALAPEVRVNALCPGGMLGAWTRKILDEKQYQERLAAAKTEYPLHRGIWPRDVAVAALFLVEGATTMTGEAIRMDCGQHLGTTSNKT